MMASSDNISRKKSSGTMRSYLVIDEKQVVGTDSPREPGVRLTTKAFDFGHSPSRLELRFYIRDGSNNDESAGYGVSVFLTRHNTQELTVIADSKVIGKLHGLVQGKISLTGKPTVLRIRHCHKSADNSSGSNHNSDNNNEDWTGLHATRLYASRDFGTQQGVVNQLRSLFQSPSVTFYVLIDGGLGAEEVTHIRRRFDRERAYDPLLNLVRKPKDTHLSDAHLTADSFTKGKRALEGQSNMDWTWRPSYMDFNEYTVVMGLAFAVADEQSRATRTIRASFTPLRGYSPPVDSVTAAAGVDQLFGFLSNPSNDSPNIPDGRDDEFDMPPIRTGPGVPFSATFDIDADAPDHNIKGQTLEYLPLGPLDAIPVQLDVRSESASGNSDRVVTTAAAGIQGLGQSHPICLDFTERHRSLAINMDALDQLRGDRCHAPIRRLLLGNDPMLLPRRDPPFPPASRLEFRSAFPLDGSGNIMGPSDQQMDILHGMLAGQLPGGVLLVNGSSATGKTTIVEHAARLIIQHNRDASAGRHTRLLILSPFNSTVDRLASSLVPFGETNGRVVVRCGSIRETKELAVKEFRRMSEEVSRGGEGGPTMPHYLKHGSLGWWILKRSELLPGTSSDVLDGAFEEVWTQCHQVLDKPDDTQRAASLMDAVGAAAGQVIKEADVILATVAIAGLTSEIRMDFKADVICGLHAESVPEAAMWPVLASQKTFKSLTLLGDWSSLKVPKDQLQRQRPTMPIAQVSPWMRCSLFERLLEAGNPCIVLSRLFSLHPDIGRLLADVFYRERPMLDPATDRLAAEITDFNLTTFNWPRNVLRVQVAHAPNKPLPSVQQGFGGTKTNIAHTVIVRHLLTCLRKNVVVRGEDVCIRTPYRGQYALYRRLRDTDNDPALKDVDLRVAADEPPPMAKIVILDLVFDKAGCGFLRNIWRIRDSLYRTQCALYIVSDNKPAESKRTTLLSRLLENLPPQRLPLPDNNSKNNNAPLLNRKRPAATGPS